MRVMLLFNPISGAGRAERTAIGLRDDLAAAGHEIALRTTRLEPTEGWLDPLLAETDLLVVAGGDGAIRLAAGAAVRTGTPIYHVPLGTENLFSREFGMDRSAGRLLRAIERGDVRRVDVGAANGRCFLLMASAGIDAEVVHDLAARRRAGISHLAYAGPIARQLLRWRPRPMTLDCDGARIVDGASGVAIVANSRQYAGRLDPAPRASMSDGVLDVVFLPARSRLDLVRWAWACARRRHLGDRRLLYRLGREVRIRADAVFRYQLDGDPPGPPNAGDDHATAELSISITPGALPVLIP